MDKGKDHIWSSVTLYEDDAIERRASLFNRFLETTSDIDASDVVDFHSNNHEDYENGFIIDRKTGLKTFSVTQAVIDPEETLLRHYDLLNHKAYEVPFSPDQLTMAIK